MKLLEALTALGKIAGSINPVIGIVSTAIEEVPKLFGDEPEAQAEGYRQMGLDYIKVGLAMIEAAQDGVLSDEEIKQIKELGSNEA